MASGWRSGKGAPSSLLSSSDALNNLKATAAAMHQEKENSKHKEAMLSEKLRVSEDTVRLLQGQLRQEQARVASLDSAAQESTLRIRFDLE